MDFIYEEFESLSSYRGPTEHFVMSLPPKETEDDGMLPGLCIYPVTKMRTVTAQKGYRRMPYTKREGSLTN